MRRIEGQATLDDPKRASYACRNRECSRFGTEVSR